MKKVALGVGVLLALFIVVLAVNAVRFESKQLSVEPIDEVGIDVEGVSSRLASAIQFPTISGGDSSLVQWAPFDSLNAYLVQTFQQTHSVLSRDIKDTHALMYTWQGQNQELDPLVLMAHLDVVPIEPDTEDAWEHPPFEGHVDQEYVWGRGAIDNKNGVMATLEAVEMLIDEGYRPERSVILAYGHDEEVGGWKGAKSIAMQLLEEGVTPWLVVDEGGIVLEDHTIPVERPVALIGVAEKGYISLALTVESAGGHSSMPGQETAIGVLSTALYRLINDPFPARLRGVTGQLFDYLGPEMAWPFRTLFANRQLLEPLIIGQLAGDPSSDATLRTTTAPTMLKGSPKDNVLPSQAEAVVNFRILPGETIESVTERVREVIDDPRVNVAPANGYGTNPSAVSSTEGEGFLALRKTIHELFPDALVAPYLVVGGTDAKHFSPLSENVYRFSPLRFRDGDLARLHGTNERILKTDYAHSIRFYRQLILNATGKENLE